MATLTGYFSLNVDKPLFEAVQRIQAEMASDHPTHEITRSSVLRHIMRKGVEAIEQRQEN